MYLVWDEDAYKFKPDFVFINLFERNFLRTVSFIWCQKGFLGIDNPNGEISKGCLGVRPTVNFTSQINLPIDDLLRSKLDKLVSGSKFKEYFNVLEKNKLNLFLPSEYEKFIEKQKTFIEREFNGKRIKKQDRQSFVLSFAIELKKQINQFKKLDQGISKKEIGDRIKLFGGKTIHFPSWNVVNHINLKLLQLLGKKINKLSANFIILDSLKFHEPANPPNIFSSMMLKRLCEFNNFGYIPIFKKLNQSKQNGQSPVWKYDPHLNQLGNKIYADQMFQYLKDKIV